jgi:hypothetical protein
MRFTLGSGAASVIDRFAQPAAPWHGEIHAVPAEAAPFASVSASQSRSREVSALPELDVLEAVDRWRERAGHGAATSGGWTRPRDEGPSRGRSACLPPRGRVSVRRPPRMLGSSGRKTTSATDAAVDADGTILGASTHQETASSTRAVLARTRLPARTTAGAATGARLWPCPLLGNRQPDVPLISPSRPKRSSDRST